MPEMTENEYREFLLEGTKTGKLATVMKDGRPHVVPVCTTWTATISCLRQAVKP